MALAPERAPRPRERPASIAERGGQDMGVRSLAPAAAPRPTPRPASITERGEQAAVRAATQAGLAQQAIRPQAEALLAQATNPQAVAKTQQLAAGLGLVSPLLGAGYGMAQGLQRSQQRTVAEQLLQQEDYEPGFFGRAMRSIGLAPTPAGYKAVFDENDNLVGSLAVDADGNPVGYTGPRMAEYTGFGREFVQPPPQREGPDREAMMAGMAPAAPTDVAPTSPEVPATTTPVTPAGPAATLPQGIASLRPMAQPMTQPMAIPPLPMPSAFMPAEVPAAPSMAGMPMMYNPYLQIGRAPGT